MDTQGYKKGKQILLKVHFFLRHLVSSFLSETTVLCTTLTPHNKSAQIAELRPAWMWSHKVVLLDGHYSELDAGNIREIAAKLPIKL